MATLLEVRERMLQRAGLEHNQDFVTTVEVNALINLKYKELYGLLARNGLLRAETPYDITANGASSYSLPDDHWATLAVFRLDGNVPIYLGRHDHRLRTSSVRVGLASSYRVVGFDIEFDPRPSSGTYTVVYIPIPAELTADTDELDGVLGFEEYIVVAGAIALGIKDKVNVDDLRIDLREIKERIIDDAKAAEMSENPTVQNVRLPREYLPGGNRGVQGYWGSPYALFRGW